MAAPNTLRRFGYEADCDIVVHKNYQGGPTIMKTSPALFQNFKKLVKIDKLKQRKKQKK